MATNCTRCDGTGFINLHQVDAPTLVEFDITGKLETIINWIVEHEDTDVSVCDCCGNRDTWYGEPGQHYNNDDPQGDSGPYAYNGGLCECH